MIESSLLGLHVQGRIQGGSTCYKWWRQAFPSRLITPRDRDFPLPGTWKLSWMNGCMVGVRVLEEHHGIAIGSGIQRPLCNSLTFVGSLREYTATPYSGCCSWKGSSLLLLNTVSLHGCWPRGSATSSTSSPVSSKPQIVPQPCWSSSYIFMMPGHYYHRAFAPATPATVSGRLRFLGLNMTDSF